MQQGELAFDSFRVSQDCRFEAVIALHPDQYFQRRIRLGDLEKMGVQAIEFIRRNPTVYLERLAFVAARNAADGLRVRGTALPPPQNGRPSRRDRARTYATTPAPPHPHTQTTTHPPTPPP